MEKKCFKTRWKGAIIVDNFDKQVEEELRGYLNKHVHFSREESQRIRRKVVNKSVTKKFHGVYYTVLASTIVLITILSISTFKNLNLNGNTPSGYFALEEKESEENKDLQASLNNLVNGKTNKSSRYMFSKEVTDSLQLAIINNPEMYKLKKASYNYWSNHEELKEITFALSFHSQQNSYFTQLFKGEINLEENHEVIEKAGSWKLIPDSEASRGEVKYIIAVSETVVNHEKYTIIVQTYDIHDDFYADPYSKKEILDFIESLQPKKAVANLLSVNTEDHYIY